MHRLEETLSSCDPVRAGSSAEERFRGLVFRGSKVEPRARATSRPPVRCVGGTGQCAPAPTQPEVAPELAVFVRGVLRQAGLDPAAYRLFPLVRRIPACLRSLKTDSIEQAARMVETDPALLGAAVNALLIGATSFFRDGPVFECLEQEVLPELLGRKSRPRVWSVSCSDGAELYSVAMLLAERDALSSGQLLGSDCRISAVAAASRGQFAAVMGESLGGRRERWFHQHNGRLEVSRVLRASIAWECRDVLKAHPPGRWDMIFCRNLAIYLESAAASAMWGRLVAALQPGGYLITGKAERPVPDGLVRTGPCIYRKSPA